MFFIICILSLLANNSHGIYTIINSKPSEVVFKYAEGIRGEGGLQECKMHEACSAVHKRFWMPIVSERLCRCPNGNECPWQWTKKPDISSMILNNRSHLKFCAPTSEEEVCTQKQSAIVIYGKGNVNNTYMLPHNVTVNCKCPQSHYWKLQKYTYEENDSLFQIFRCVKQKTCDSLEFCGYVRSDLYSVYYRCTCPQRHLCIYRNKTQENVQELLYSGPAYKAHCYPS